MGAVLLTWARESAPNPLPQAAVNVDSGQSDKKKEQITHHQRKHLYLVPLPQDILEGSENSLEEETEFKYYRIGVVLWKHCPPDMKWLLHSSYQLWLLTQSYARSNYLKSQQRWGRQCSGPTLTEELLAADKLRGRRGNHSAWRVRPLVSFQSFNGWPQTHVHHQLDLVGYQKKAWRGMFQRVQGRQMGK